MEFPSNVFFYPREIYFSGEVVVFLSIVFVVFSSRIEDVKIVKVVT